MYAICEFRRFLHCYSANSSTQHLIHRQLNRSQTNSVDAAIRWAHAMNLVAGIAIQHLV